MFNKSLLQCRFNVHDTKKIQQTKDQAKQKWKTHKSKVVKYNRIFIVVYFTFGL
jgi:hypothetical protein